MAIVNLAAMGARWCNTVPGVGRPVESKFHATGQTVPLLCPAGGLRREVIHCEKRSRALPLSGLTNTAVTAWLFRLDGYPAILIPALPFDVAGPEHTHPAATPPYCPGQSRCLQGRCAKKHSDYG